MKDFLLFHLEGRRFALPLDVVQRVTRMVEITSLPDAPEKIAGAVNIHGEAAAAIDLRRHCGLPSRPSRISDHLIIARQDNRGIALIVDAAGGVLSLSEERIRDGKEFGAATGTATAVLIADGDIVLITDLGRFLEDAEAALEAVHAPAAR